MRLTRLLSIVAVALMPSAVRGQEPSPPAETPQPAAKEAGTTPWTGRVDFGIRGTAMNGDGARYECYRDLGDGLFIETGRANRERNGWLLDFGAEHVGRRDQRYVGTAVRPGRLQGSFMWDQIPMLLSNTTRTLYDGVSTPVLTIDDPLQAIVQVDGN